MNAVYGLIHAKLMNYFSTNQKLIRSRFFGIDCRGMTYCSFEEKKTLRRKTESFGENGNG